MGWRDNKLSLPLKEILLYGRFHRNWPHDIDRKLSGGIENFADGC